MFQGNSAQGSTPENINQEIKKVVQILNQL